MSIKLRLPSLQESSGSAGGLTEEEEAEQQCLKWTSLLILVAQNSALTIVLCLSRQKGAKLYFVSTAVTLGELFKLVVSLVVYVLQERKSRGELFSWTRIVTTIFNKSILLLFVPAVAYTIQNNLQYVAATHLDAATFQITYQMKILTTALCSVLLLGRRLTWIQWFSLFLLTLGVAAVQMPTGSPAPSSSSIVENSNESNDRRHSSPLQPRAPSAGGRGGDRGEAEEFDGDGETATVASVLEVFDEFVPSEFVGLASVTGACLLSGFAGVWLEKVLKQSRTALWARNVQMALISLPPAVVFGNILSDGMGILDKGFFFGYNSMTWFAVFFQASGGLIVASVVKYADNILKGFATSISILISTAFTFFLFEAFHLTVLKAVGALMVILATILFSIGAAPAPLSRPPSPIHSLEAPPSPTKARVSPPTSRTPLLPDFKVEDFEGGNGEGAWVRRGESATGTSYSVASSSALKGGERGRPIPSSSSSFPSPSPSPSQQPQERKERDKEGGTASVDRGDRIVNGKSGSGSKNEGGGGAKSGSSMSVLSSPPQREEDAVPEGGGGGRSELRQSTG
uniref:Uncharacterized protein n=1 Tax=Chromera velia CCMP2878 TaxID=1169474 RepID=A0A0G4GMY4_9ALVE|eukprot:Cvel_4937.t1-p1 / transcript=Cvel_4937.t1 / gene=Cvel_4937 / organism=Chromera_velia_CCMP2878 / gene_product=UDP-galactose transporter, putative / transcript_product=UDP-galactose transporter, putative / location=Cvel_scaffold223:38225-42544(+) / protein_length=570 / sequence_SO=supercontig / SO=protein_coding / is_pseudo=false